MTATTLVASAARTVTGSSAAIPIGSGVATLELELEITAVTGTSPTLVLSVTWSDDGVNFGADDAGAVAFASQNAAVNVVKTITVKAPYMMLTWTLGGTTPSFTFSVVDVTSNAI